jgi:hypothetical protein
LQRVIMAECPIIDKVPHLDVLGDQLQEAVDGLLDESQIRGQQVMYLQLAGNSSRLKTW